MNVGNYERYVGNCKPTKKVVAKNNRSMECALDLIYFSLYLTVVAGMFRLSFFLPVSVKGLF